MSKIAVYFPGIGYHCDKPLLYYSRNIESIGTIIAMSFAEKYGLKYAISFIGSADPWSDTNEIIRLSNANHIPLTVYDGCNHSLECNDTLKNIENLKDIMQRTMDFCRGTH